MKSTYIEKGKRYDYSLKTKEDRTQFVDDKLGFILNAPAYMLMGYSSSALDGDTKNDKIPKMIDAYASYILRAQDVESSRKTEYSFYIDRREEVRRKGSLATSYNASSFDDVSEDGSLGLAETYNTDGNLGISDYLYAETINSQILKYAISSGNVGVSDYKKILSISSDILFETKDAELKGLIEQVIFNCYINTNDDIDVSILKEYIKGETLRDIADKVGVSKDTVNRRLTKTLKWVRQELA